MSDRMLHYQWLIKTYAPIEAAAVARTLGEEELAAKVLAGQESKFIADAPVKPRRAVEQRKYIEWALLHRKASPEHILICARAMGEGSFTENVIAELQK